MRKALLGVAGIGALLLAGATPSHAGSVNCGIINKDLKMGRTPQDISERMMVSVEDVKKCQEEAAKAEAGAPAGAKGGEQKPAAGAGAETHTGH